MPKSLLVTEIASNSQKSNAAWIINWNDEPPPSGQVSALQLIEPLSEQLRKDYLKWIYDLGITDVGGKTVRDRLYVPELGYSAWWFSLLAEKSKYKSKLILETLKLRATEIFIWEKKITSLTYEGTDPVRREIFQNLSLALGIQYFHTDTKVSATQKKSFLPLRAIYQLLHVFLAKYIPTRILFHRMAIHGFREAALVGVTYFPNLDPVAFQQGLFRPAYWGNLGETLKKDARSLHWIAITPGLDQTRFPTLIRMMNQINESEHELKTPVIPLEFFYSTKIFFQALKIYARLFLRSKHLFKKIKFPLFPDSHLNLSPLIQKDWQESFTGGFATQEILFSLGFQRAMKKMKSARTGIFLMEGQAWERAFVQACRKVKDCLTLGSQHSALRKMDFRMFQDSRAYEDRPENDLLPDFIVANGKGAKNHLLQAGCPERKIAEGEALRYTYLQDCFSKFYSAPEVQKKNGLTLLVILDYLIEESRFQLQMVRDALAMSSGNTYSRVVIKPHPSTVYEKVIQGMDLPENFEIEKQKSLRELWEVCDVVCCSNITSSAIEAAWLGLPVITLRNFNDLNLSPLFGIPGYSFPQNAAELNKVLLNPARVEIHSDYFHTDPDLPRWRELVSKGMKSDR